VSEVVLEDINLPPDSFLPMVANIMEKEKLA